MSRHGYLMDQARTRLKAMRREGSKRCPGLNLPGGAGIEMPCERTISANTMLCKECSDVLRAFVRKHRPERLTGAA